MLRGFLFQPPPPFSSYWGFLFAARILDGLEVSLRPGPTYTGRAKNDRTALRASTFSDGAAARGIDLSTRAAPPVSPEMSRTFDLLKHWGMTDVAVARLARKVKPVHLAEASVSCRLRWLATKLLFSKKDAMRVVESFPPFLTYSVEEQLGPFVGAFLERGCSKADVKRIILENPFILARRDRSIRSIAYVQDTLGLEKSEAAKIFVKRPDLLSLNITPSLKSILDCLFDLGLSKSEVGSLACKSPYVLTRSPENLNKNFDKFRGLGLSDIDVGKILMGCPTLMWNDFDKTVVEKLRWLEIGLGFDRRLSLDCLLKYPVRFVASLETWTDTYWWILSKGMSEQKAQEFFKENFVLFSLRSGGLNGRYAFAKDILKKTVGDVLASPEYLQARFDLIITRVAFLRSLGVEVEEIPLNVIVLEKSRFDEMYGDDSKFLEYMKWKGLTEDKKVHIASRGTWGKMLGRGAH
ncbi:hypothetical protein BSKO_13363 [Bryopsis sp. KO-2023]|nr:hypothetical protein BSKO_13363 [Bryopsis sp. KO-2023]